MVFQTVSLMAAVRVLIGIVKNYEINVLLLLRFVGNTVGAFVGIPHENYINSEFINLEKHAENLS